MKETILVFNMSDEEQLLQLELALFPFHVQLKNVALKDYLNPLGFLAGDLDIPPSPLPYEGKELSDPMLIFSHIEDDKLEQILAALRASSLPPIPYKAILTPTNSHWNPIACFEELKREHEAMNP